MKNNINTKLSLLYDDEFNVKYDYSNRLNREISIKDKIININNQQYEKNILKVKILKLVLLMVGILVFITLLIAVRIFGKTFGLSLMIVVVIAFIIRILVVKYSKRIDFNKENKMTTKYFEINAGESANYNPKCPSKCKAKPNPNPNIVPTRINEKVKNKLKTDSSLNVWLYGDQPEALYYNPRIYGNKYDNPRITEDEETIDKPQPWFNQITENTEQKDPIQGVTYYNCVKELSPKGTPVEFRTTIPCNYYPGYETLNKCIFDDNNCNPV